MAGRPSAERAVAERLIRSGVGTEEVARRTGLTRRTVQRIRLALGIPSPVPAGFQPGNVRGRVVG